MRAKGESGSLIVHAVAGTHVVFRAVPMAEPAPLSSG